MRKFLGTLVAILTLVGCDSQGAVAGQSSDGGSSSRDPGFTATALPDPGLGGMAATVVTTPAGWRVDGQMNFNPCNGLPDPAWTATSQDGRSTYDVLPSAAWRWGGGAKYAHGCVPLSRALSATDFLTLLAAKLPGHLQILGNMPVANAFRHRAENFAAMANENNARLLPMLRADHTADVAAVRAVDASGRELRLRTWIECKQSDQGGDCFAKVDILAAPRGRLNVLTIPFDSHNLSQDVPDSRWASASLNRQQQVADGQRRALADAAQANSNMLRAQFEASSARLRAQHNADMQQIQSSGQHAMQSAWNSMNARTTAASDWRDYAADQQTVSGANGTYKTGSQYSNVWSSPNGPALSNGRTVGSTDNTLNPNTATDNTFTQDRRVHGNGQPY